jgi:hypothetical protein
MRYTSLLPCKVLKMRIHHSVNSRSSVALHPYCGIKQPEPERHPLPIHASQKLKSSSPGYQTYRTMPSPLPGGGPGGGAYCPWPPYVG